MKCLLLLLLYVHIDLAIYVYNIKAFYRLTGRWLFTCVHISIFLVSEMDESLDVSGIVEEDIQVHSCECGYYTKDKSNYNKHAKKCKWHGPSTSTPAKQAPSTSTSQDETSQASTSGKAPRSYMCDACGKHCKTNYGLRLHIKSKHERNFKHECSMCKKTFNQTVQYRYHCSTHLKVQIDKCPHCKDSFSSHGSLARHLKTCSSNKDSFQTFKCNQCSASFPHKNRLRYHQRGKHGEKRYTCEGCNKAFAWRSSLSVHRRHCPSASN